MADAEHKTISAHTPDVRIQYLKICEPEYIVLTIKSSFLGLLGLFGYRSVFTPLCRVTRRRNAVIAIGFVSCT